MYKNKKIIKFVLVCALIASIFLPRISHAETHVYENDVQEGWSWDKAGSPYILEEPIYVPRGSTLNIGEGVDIVSTTTALDGPYSLTFDGDLNVFGTKENPVKFTDLYSLYFSNDTSVIKNAVFNKTGLDFIKATSTIESVTITGAFNGINAKASRINVSNSNLNHNSYGISSNMNSRLHQVLNSTPNTGGEGNVLAGLFDSTMDDTQNIISINDSQILDNKNFGIINQTSNMVDATNNWWGRKEGPSPLEIFGAINISPWKEKDPSFEDGSLCCSSVLFIPGFEASRLYDTGSRLWEPSSNDNVRRLYMDQDGNSIDPSIRAKDILIVALGIKAIYKRFADYMDTQVFNGTMHAWLPLPYDWRKGVYNLADDFDLKNITDLASTSITGKVTIIAHSNGGLFTKALMRKLEGVGKSNIIDRIINIAVPELGTPEALEAMLHGTDQGIAAGLILDENNARTFSQNLPGAYGLLPTKKFFEKNPITVINDTFSKTPIAATFEKMKEFILNGSFSKATTTDTSIPLRLNSKLLFPNEIFHESVDNWRSSSTTKTFSIFGWGEPTMEGIVYKSEPHCVKNFLKLCPILHTSISTTSGDGTVLTKSSSGNSDSISFFNLKKLHKERWENINHANILNSAEMLSKINQIVTNTKVSTTSPPDYEKYFSSTEPIDDSYYLSINVYSPVDIDVYDRKGHHTGLIYDPQFNQYVPDENSIPGSKYEHFGTNKRVIVPFGEEYQISLSGNDAGLFIVDAQVSSPRGFNDIIASTTFSELPVTFLTNIDLIIATTTASLASTTVMNIDIDGDGDTDVVSHPIEFLHSTTTDFIKDMPTYLESMRKVIVLLGLPPSVEKIWLNRIDGVAKVAQKKDPKKLEKIVRKLSTKRFKNKKISEVQKTVILKLFENLLLRLENNDY